MGLDDVALHPRCRLNGRRRTRTVHVLREPVSIARDLVRAILLSVTAVPFSPDDDLRPTAIVLQRQPRSILRAACHALLNKVHTVHTIMHVRVDRVTLLK